MPRVICVILLISCARAWSDAEHQIAAVVSQMTLPEKVRQLDTFSGNDLVSLGALNWTLTNETLGGLGIGRLHDIYCTDPNVCNQIQQAVMANSRFGIGAIVGEECTHGYQKDGHTIFPAPLSSAATFNASLMYDIGRGTGSEARVHGTHECWGPILGLAREPRWGRTNEELGEDVFLAKSLGAAITRGLQYDGNFSSGLAVAALLKHYVMYSVPQNGLNTAPAHLGRRAALSEYLPVFCESIRAGALGAMSSYNSVDGDPVSGSSYYLTELLRGECGFEGAVVADFGAISRLYQVHGVAAGPCDAVFKYLLAGGNMRGSDLQEWESCLVQQPNLTTEAKAELNVAIDARVTDVLRVKARLGLVPLDGKPVQLTDPSLVSQVNDSPAHRETALLAALEAQVLLNNSGASALPWSAGSIPSVAVIGPNSDQPRFGDYTGAEHHRGGNVNNRNCVGVLEAAKRAFPHAKLTHVLGSSVSGPTAQCGGGPEYYQPVWRHHYYTDSTHSSQGLRAQYFSNQDLTGTPALEQTDWAVSFHWFRWGPNPIKLPSTQFSARWDGELVSDSTVSGGLQLWVDRCTAGARLWLDGHLVVDQWDNYTAQGAWPVKHDFKAGVPIAVRLEFRKIADGNNGAELELQWDQVGATGMKDAEAAAATSAATILVLGGSDQTSNEGIDRASLRLPGDQLQLLQRVAAAVPEGGKLAVVLVDTKPMAEPWVKDHIGVLLESFAAGQAQGTATLEVITGGYNPAGRLPISFPRSADMLPAYYSYEAGARGSLGYCDGPSTPLWGFGHGLSFSKFSYSNLSISVGQELVTVRFWLSNTGGRAGDEVPQMYIRDVVSSTTTPVMALKGFARVHLTAGEQQQVLFRVNITQELAVIGVDYKRRVEPGTFDVMVGAASDNVLLRGSFELTQGRVLPTL